MTPTSHSTTQPVLGHAYSAMLIDDIGREEPVSVVYRGIDSGHCVVAYTDGNEYYATRTSELTEEPKFSFKFDDKVPK